MIYSMRRLHRQHQSQLPVFLQLHSPNLLNPANLLNPCRRLAKGTEELRLYMIKQSEGPLNYLEHWRQACASLGVPEILIIVKDFLPILKRFQLLLFARRVQTVIAAGVTTRARYTAKMDKSRDMIMQVRSASEGSILADLMFDFAYSRASYPIDLLGNALAILYDKMESSVIYSESAKCIALAALTRLKKYRKIYDGGSDQLRSQFGVARYSETKRMYQCALLRHERHCLVLLLSASAILATLRI